MAKKLRYALPDLALFFICFAGVFAASTVAHAQADYEYQTIEYPGAVLTDVRGINDRGDVVGYASIVVDEDLETVLFVYDSKDYAFMDVAPVAGYDFTGLMGISDSGILVGFVGTDEPFSRSGLILEKDGNAIVFDHPDAATETNAWGVNNKGLVVGYYDVDEEDEIFRGFIYDPKTDTFTDIVPSAVTIAADINSRGDAVGSAFFYDFGDGPTDPCGDASIAYYGWLRKADGTVIYFDVNGWSTRARGITDSGTIVGWANADYFRGFVTKLDDAPCQSITILESDLLFPPDTPGDAFVTFQGIKNSGEVVGWDGSHSFIATPQ